MTENLINQLVQIFLAKIRYVGTISQFDILQLATEFESLQQIAEPIILNEIQSEYSKTLKNLMDIGLVKNRLNDFGGLSKEMFDTIVALDTKTVLRSFDGYSSIYTNELIKGMFAGQNYNQLSQKISEEISAPPNWVIAQIDATQDMSNQTILQKVFEDDPNQRFVLAGALDDKTRCQCRAVLLNQPKEGYTIQEINNGAWTRLALEHCPKFAKDKATGGEYTWQFRGGFNCRHRGKPVEMED